MPKWLSIIGTLFVLFIIAMIIWVNLDQAKKKKEIKRLEEMNKKETSNTPAEEG